MCSASSHTVFGVNLLDPDVGSTWKGDHTCECKPNVAVSFLRRSAWQTRDADILHQVAKLSSHISRKEAMRKLSRMRKDKAHKGSFTNSLPMFLLVHQLLADYRFVTSPQLKSYASDVVAPLQIDPTSESVKNTPRHKISESSSPKLLLSPKVLRETLTPTFPPAPPVFVLRLVRVPRSFSLPMRRYIFELFEQVTPGTSDWEPYVA